YMVGVMSGLALLIWCFLPAGWRAGPARSWGRRIAILALTGAVSLGILGLSLNRDHGFGPSITAQQHEIYPEAGPEGRYWAEWHGLPQDLALAITTTFDANARQGQAGGLKGQYFALDRLADAHKMHLGFALLGLFVLAMILVRRRELSGIVIFMLTAGLLYLASIALFPLMFFPKRFFQLTVPLTTALLFVWAGREVILQLR
ncbi:MAG: hypothetical protein OIF40_12840, partial [Mangrovicoccus sp.]|nr:hypothetical protein [Mangrovicoccus sp.]